MCLILKRLGITVWISQAPGWEAIVKYNSGVLLSKDLEIQVCLGEPDK